MGNGIQKVVTELPSKQAEGRAQQCDSQFGSGMTRSPVAAAAIMVNRANTTWKEDNITGVLLVDIKAPFPSIAREMLIHAMKAKKIDGDLIR